MNQIEISKGNTGVVATNSTVHIHKLNVGTVQHEAQQTINVIQDKDYNMSKSVDTFRGRDDELNKLKTWLFHENKTKVVVCGLPGIGKTELTRQFAERCKEEGLIRSIIWIDAETPENIEHSFRELRERLGGKTESNIHDVIQTVHQHYRGDKHMFIFDNAVDRQSICEFEPPKPCVCVVTSHEKTWGPGMEPLLLTTLSVQGAIDVLHAVLEDYFSNEDKEQYHILVELLSCIPLALQVAAAFLREEFEEAKDLGEQYNVQDYIQQLQNSCKKVITEPIPKFVPNSYEKSVSQAIEISLFKIKNSKKPNSKLAGDILDICPYLNSGKILHEDLVNILHYYNRTQNSNDDIQKACALLSKYSFIFYDNKQICIHRLIQSTLVINQTNLFQNNYNPFYLSCLQYLLEDINYENFEYHRHRHYILKYSKEHLHTSLYFFSENKKTILGEVIFIQILTFENCEIFLNEIFNFLGREYAVKYINKYELLHAAIQCHQYDMMKMLLERGAHVEGKSDPHTYLMLAANNIDIKAMPILLSYGANASATCIDHGNSVLHTLTKALRKSENIFKSEKVREGIEMLLQYGASINVVDNEKKTLLHIIASAFKPELISYLVDNYKLDVNAEDIRRETPLFHICYPPGKDIGKRIATAWTLFKLGANLHVRNKMDLMPAEFARNRGLEDLAFFLDNPLKNYVVHTSRTVDELKVDVAKGDLPTIVQKLNELGDEAIQLANQSCLLHIAVECQHYEVIKMLLCRGIEVNSKDDIKNTALHIATENIDLCAMQELVQHGADIDVINSEDDSVLRNLLKAHSSKCKNNEHVEALRWLLAQGVRTDSEVLKGSTMLNTAAFFHNAHLVRFLVTEYELDANVKDETGRSPIMSVYWGWTSQSRLKNEYRAMATVACLVELGARLDPPHLLMEFCSIFGISPYERLKEFFNKAEAYVQQLSYKDTNKDTQRTKTVPDNLTATLTNVAAAILGAAIAMGAWWFLGFQIS